MLYQLSYIGSQHPGHASLTPAATSKIAMLKILERETGIEPATNSLEGCDSTTELLPPFTSTAAPIRKIRSQSKTSQHRQSHCPRRLHRRIIQRPPCRNSQHDEQKHREKKTAHARSLLIKPNLNNGAQGRIRTSVARKERQIYSLLPLTTRPPVRNSAAHFTSKIATRTRQNHDAKQHKLSGTQQRSALAPWKIPNQLFQDCRARGRDSEFPYR